MSQWHLLPNTCLLLAALATTSAGAALPLKIVGFDDMSCRAWVASKNDAEQRAAYVAWVRGVLTGHNYANPNQQISAISSSTVEQYVDRHCSEKPQGSFSDAALRLTDRFSGRNAPITK
ncbi:MAG TPA: hypothetical protein PK440_05070 [Candidatus Accumulibacter phosphatis]|nr:hypothetical protein [Candidatus Accumulibacter phosphatis]HRQ94367.1 hypothetical protein [Candidatus Accumulibacter phosphatis]